MTKSREFVSNGKKILKIFEKHNVTKRWLRLNASFRYYYHVLHKWCKAHFQELSIALCAKEFQLGKTQKNFFQAKYTYQRVC